ncbi:hypothetical protein HPB48_012843 [Haemaphysalis longicornis]|uniref:Uncharacterized protein n=1 Tax=Haemaphysalis longicornis TaxID=44386 RepID=A0A9J6FN66_HAELO|nr:hypothetical protein HPB48_012843 [Haemaphysalis longicornis]
MPQGESPKAHQAESEGGQVVARGDADNLAGDIEPKMPVACGEMSGRLVSVLRDSGSTTVLVRRSLVRQQDLTGNMAVIIMADSTGRPEAILEVQTPYYSGKLKARCMEDPLYDIILGNIPGARRVEEPDPNWRSKLKHLDLLLGREKLHIGSFSWPQKHNLIENFNKKI